VVEKEVAKKEAVEKEAQKDDEDEEDEEAAAMTTPSTPIDFLESSVRSSVPFPSDICMSSRTMCSSTSKTSSRRIWGCLTWSNSIASFPGFSKQTCVTREDHELDL
jgi:hypothetical protein